MSDSLGLHIEGQIIYYVTKAYLTFFDEARLLIKLITFGLRRNILNNTVHGLLQAIMKNISGCTVTGRLSTGPIMHCIDFVVT